MQNDPCTHGLWERTAPPPPDTTRLDRRLSADVVVVGGGFTGLSAALHLAGSGARVVVLEAADIGFGASGRNVGLVNAGLWMMPDDVQRGLGDEYGARLLTLLGAAPGLVYELVERHGVECELERNGTLHCAVGAGGLRELEQRAAQWLARGAPVQLLNAAQAAEEIGSPAFTGALLDHRAGTIQPLAYVRGLAHAAMKAGAQVFTNSPVIRCSSGAASSLWQVETVQGAVSASWVVVATNAYTTTPWPQVRAELIHLPYFNFATAPLPDEVCKAILPGRQGAWDTRQVLSSLRLDRAGRLIFGSVGALRGTGAAVHGAWARRALRRLFPQFSSAFSSPDLFETQWYGKIGMTADSLPRLHRFADRVIGFSGYNGRGIGPGTAFGRVLAEHIAGQLREADLPLPLSDPREPALRSVRELGYEVGAQLVHFTAARLS